MSNFAIDGARLLNRIEALGAIGATPEGGVRRIALDAADKAGRDQVVAWMRAAGLAVEIDAIGNIFGTRSGEEGGLRPVMTGSHIDTVVNGGKLDGALGVLAGLELIESLNDYGIATRRPFVVAAFTNEEGVRFQPDMMGSLVHAGGLPLEEALDARDREGQRLGDALDEIGYTGDLACGAIRPHAFLELHIEQGPVLEAEGLVIGAVEDLQGISWREIVLEGQANHAGTTPMALRRDAGYGAAAIAHFLRQLAAEIGGGQVATVGTLSLEPGVINVVPRLARMTVDLRNSDEAALKTAEAKLDAFVTELSEAEGLKTTTRPLARFQPVTFDPRLVEMIEGEADALGLSCRRMTSGAGHDAQMMARTCPTAMIFVPSIGGVSHNPAEATAAEHLLAGANLLSRALLLLLDEPD